MRADPIRTPTRVGEVWLHVDRFDKPNRRVWALQYRKGRTAIYLTARSVLVLVPMQTCYRDGPRQPRAYLVARDARVRWRGAEAIIEAL
jgi:hypothetical protein